MLIAGNFYTVEDILKDAGLPMDYIDGKDLKVSGVQIFSISQLIRIQRDNDLIVSAGSKEKRVEAVLEEDFEEKVEEKKVEKAKAKKRSSKRVKEVEAKVEKSKKKKK